MRKLLTFTLLLFYGTAALAAVEKPSELAPYIHATAPYGQGSYTRLWVKAYDASLWTDASEWSMRVPFALTLHYRMHFTSGELADRSIEEMQHIEPLTQAEAVGFKAQLIRLFPEVNDGDEITALYVPPKGAKIFYNGKLTGRIADDNLAQRFLGIWLSDKTSAPDLRRQLLGGGINTRQ